MKILIVDDHPLVRRGLSAILSFEEDIDIILEASSREEAEMVIEREEPTLAIIDLYLGKEYGLDIVISSKKREVKTKFIILTSSLKKEDFIRCKEVGVEGYILKEAFAEDILYAVHLVLRGKQFIDPEIVKYEITNNHKNTYLDELTPREQDVFMELGKGLSNCEIAENSLYQNIL